MMVGDVCGRVAVQKALKGVDTVYHFTALVGVGQSKYGIAHYTDVNNSGTATLLEALIEKPVVRLAIASSMSIYSAGLYHAPDGSLVSVPLFLMDLFSSLATRDLSART